MLVKFLKLSAVAGILFSLLPAYAAPKKEYTHRDFTRIASMTSRILARNHYSNVPVDEKLSQKIFDQFFNSIDPLHMFFTAGDIDKFAAKRSTIANDLMNGEYQFAFDVYAVYRSRYARFREFTGKMLESDIDFSINESIPADLTKEPRPENEKEMFELWRKYVKNEILSLQLSARIEKEERPKDAPSPVNPPKTPAQRILQRQRDIGNDIAQKDKIDILGILLDSMAQTYGAHSDYQAPKLSEDFEIQMSLSLSGIGATLTSEDGYIKIVELVPGGPAELSGKLKVNDRIVSVTQENGESTDLVDMPVSKAVQFIRGEKGTAVTLEVLSGNSTAPVKITITRDKIKLTEGAAKGEVKEVNGVKVGIINLPSFYMDFDAAMRGDANARKASTDVLKILEDFKEQQVQSVVIDLRSNGGGSLPDAVTLTGLFMKGGPVVQVRAKNGLEVERDPSREIAYAGPLVLLTSKLSASSTEIFTGALRDARRAVVVGDSRTFGKGTVLRVESLDRYSNWFKMNMPAGSLTFEIAMFFRPGGSSVQQLGIKPDIQLPSLTEEMNVGEMYLNNHLPWDCITPVKINVWDNDLETKIAQLKENSAKRIAENANYQAFIRQIELYRTLRDRKTISLNEEERYAEYKREKQISEEAEKLLKEEKNTKDAGDVILNEAICIAKDLYTLSIPNK